MQLNKQLVIIVVLASFLISSVVTALYFYKKNKEIVNTKSEMVTLYIAKEDIQPNTLIQTKHLAQTQIARQYVLNTPLTMKEILGKYTNERIYKHEVFLKQKLDTKLKQEKKKILPFNKSAYNMKFALFQNPNLALQQGEYINIISVYPKTADKKPDFSVQYIAPKIKVIGFLRQGKYESQTFTKQKVTKVINKKRVEVIEEVKADEMILDIDLDVLTKLVRDYNRGRQLWMTKINHTDEPEIKEEPKKEEIEIIAKVEDVVKTPKKKLIKPIKYKYEMYTAKDSSFTRVARIDYGNSASENSKTKAVNIKVDKNRICSNIDDKFIVANVAKLNIRSSNSLQSAIANKVKKNTIIPYIMKIDDWYKICDGNYVHKSVVKEFSPEQVKNKLGKYE